MEFKTVSFDDISSKISTPRTPRTDREKEKTQQISYQFTEELTHVINSKKEQEPYDFSKIQGKIQRLIDIEPKINVIHAATVTGKVGAKLYNNISTSEIDMMASDVCENLAIETPEYTILAARLLAENTQKYTSKNIREVYDEAMNYFDKDTGKIIPLIHPFVYEFVKENAEWLNSVIDDTRDFLLTRFGIMTLREKYLLRNTENKIIERIQFMRLREAMGIHVMSKLVYKELSWEEIKKRIVETYNLTSTLKMTGATPTIQNASTPFNQLISCNLGVCDDTTESISRDCSYSAAVLSKHGAGVSISFDPIRANGSRICGTGAKGRSAPLYKTLRIYEAIFDLFDQGGGKRRGSMSAYLSIHNVNIFDFLTAIDKHSPPDITVLDIFYGLSIHEYFEKRVKNKEMWSLFNSKLPEVQELNNLWGKKYIDKYLELEEKKLYTMQVPSVDLWRKICKSRIENGMPYLCNMDAFNRKSNQQNIGSIIQSNLCTEIALPTKPGEWQNCVINSIAVQNFIYDSYSEEELKLPVSERRKLNHEFPENPVVNYEELAKVAGIANRNLDTIIDINHYAQDCIKKPNLESRPTGIGVQGLADAFHKCKLVYGSPEANQLSANLHEAILYGAMVMSNKRAAKYGAYPLYKNSPLYHGYYQPDMWNIEKLIKEEKLPDLSIEELINLEYKQQMDNVKYQSDQNLFNWDILRELGEEYGFRNSEFTADMPTASTSQILGSNEGTEPFTSNLYIRSTDSGMFFCINKYLIHEMRKLNIDNKRLGLYLALNKGSVANLDGMPDILKKRFATVWEMKKVPLIDLAYTHGRFITQSESRNIYISPENLSVSSLTTLDMKTMQRGIKTIAYYLRSKPAKAIELPISKNQEKEIEDYTEKLKDYFKENAEEATSLMPGATNSKKICLSCQ
jgi:ribonucleoside-diphosphate reductase alpha subunit